MNTSRASGHDKLAGLPLDLRFAQGEDYRAARAAIISSHRAPLWIGRRRRQVVEKLTHQDSHGILVNAKPAARRRSRRDA